MPALNQSIPNWIKHMPEVDWRFGGHKSLAKVKTNYVYHKLIDMYAWMVEQSTKGGTQD